MNYLNDKTYGFSAGYFHTDGNRDTLRYDESLTGSPKNDGMIFQLSYLPFNKRGGPAFLPDSNVKISLQYKMYNHFNGARSNYDGSGRNASDNNALYLETWIVF